MNPITIAVSVTIGIGAGIFLEKALSKMHQDKLNGKIDSLRSVFGEPMCTTTFSLTEVTDWIRSHEELIKGGSKAIITKTNTETMKEFSKEQNYNGIEGYLLMAIIGKENTLQESLLVKYEKIDKALEDKLEKGRGTLVVEDN